MSDAEDRGGPAADPVAPAAWGAVPGRPDTPDREPEAEPGPEPEPIPARRPVGARTYAIVPVAVLLFALMAVRLPYFVFAPGSATDVEPLIHVSGAPTYQSQGHLLLTDVAFYVPNSFQALYAWWSPSEAVVPQSDYLAPGQGQQDFIQAGFQEMDTSKIDAAYVALKRVTDYPADHGPGQLVAEVVPQLPADGKIRTGEVITAVNGVAIDGNVALSKAIRGAGYGVHLRFTLKDGPKTRSVVVTTTHEPGVPFPVVGIVTVPNFPFEVRINSQGIGGPSAGLMWTLGLIDVLTPGDLTGGAKIAGTGTIDPSGHVGAIGGVEQKVVAAERTGAKVFFVPINNANAAKSVANGSMAIVPVQTYSQALNYLRAHGGRF